MSTKISRQRVTIAHIQREQEKERLRYARLIQPKLKAESGTRITMLRDLEHAAKNILRELLIKKGYLSNAKVPF